MTRHLTLQDFSSPQSATPVPAATAPPAQPTASAEDALAAFDRGYKSGWDDCAAAEEQERSSISADLARHLSEAKLTYDAARRDVLTALGPFFEEVIGTLLPEIAAAAVLPVVLQEIGPLAESQSATGVELHAAPSAMPRLQKLCEDNGLSEITVRPEPAFSEGQVSLRLGAERRDIDMTAAAEKIAEAISSFRTQSTGGASGTDSTWQGAA